MKKRLVSALACAAISVTGLAAAPAAHAETIGNEQGCTPGYWKQQQHFDSWQEAMPSSSFARLFRISSPTGYLDGLTFLQALQGNGGSGLVGAQKILARAAAAAYLNAAYDAPDGSAMLFPWRRSGTGFNGEPPLIDTVRAAITGTDRQAMLDLAAQLDAANNLGCPLS